MIACGGIGTIVSVATVFLFLASVVFWLFVPAAVGPPQPVKSADLTAAPRQMSCDEHRTIGWTLSSDGTLAAFRLDTGKPLSRRPLVEDKEGPALTAASFQVDGEHAAFGFADGSIRLGKIGFQVDYLTLDDAPAAARSLAVKDRIDFQEALYVRVSEDRIRRSQLKVELDEPIAAKSPSPIRLISSTERTDGPMFCALAADGTLTFNTVTKRYNQITEETIQVVHGGTARLPRNRADAPAFLLVSGLGQMAYVAWSDGSLLRYDVRNLKQPVVAEELNLLGDSLAALRGGLKLTQLKMLLGGSTLLAGDSSGRVRAWFTVKSDPSKDESLLTAAHEFIGPSSEVRYLAANPQWRMFAAGYANGDVRLYYVTSDRLLAEVSTRATPPAAAAPLRAIMLAPKGDALYAVTSNQLTAWTIDPRHPEATIATLFLPVAYEGSTPVNAWQTTGGTDDFEAKLGLMPLIFGTLKATFYSMLFGAPLALMAAIFTSEFLHPRTKARVKPLIEMMASLPSVVLGFLAGIIFAKLLEDVVPQALATLFMVPLAFMSGAYLWQLLPRPFALRYQRWKLAAMAVCLPLGVAAGWWMGPQLERALFAGDLKAWLANPEKYSNGIGGWLILMLPLAGLIVALLMTRLISPFLRTYTYGFARRQLVLLDLAKFIAGVALTIGVAYLMSVVWYYFLGMDPRDPEPLKQHLGLRLYPLGSYVPRNALILGMMMGFAIIPLIYTVAEDALSSVPQHLKSASLGAGATPWQTAMRIVLPTAMSGLFSAVMIGLGRAVGETMIVLMAAGNTPIEQMNIFNGFQTLSAAIATEMSEAAAGSTHYRVLFLAGLTLFVMTFFVNSVAEVVRLRFRRRAYEL
ncbi:MAG TPA: ABC transporter permease subunit [Pirellulales bacterium]|nr:ABC transporter permease subunit [Pirellulales bacterium]